MLLRFADFEADLDSSRLFKAGSRVPIQEKPFQVLAMLLARSGQLVTREQISEQVWADAYVSEDQSVNTAIRKVRLALHDSSSSPKFIETVGSRGYRFVHPVESVDDRNPAQRVVTVAVLPFENLGPREDDPISDGLTELIISQLGRLRPKFEVIGLPSVLRYKGSQKSVSEILADLGGDYLLSGSIRHAGEQVRITARLVSGVDQTCVWSRAFEVDLGGLSSVRNEIAARVASSTARLLVPGESTGAVDSAAYQLYLRGRFFWNKNTAPGLLRSVQLFNRVLAQQPDFSLAYVGLADAYIMLVQYGILSGIRTYPVVKEAALKALALDGKHADPFVSLAWVKYVYERNWPAAQADCQTAIRHNPSYSFAYIANAFVLTSQARHDESIDSLRRGLHVDPVSVSINAIYAFVLYLARRYPEAIEQCRECIDLDPLFPNSYGIYGQALEAEGDLAGATELFKKELELAPWSPFALANLGRIHARLGQRQQTLGYLDRLLSAAASKYVSPYSIAQVYLALGDTESALKYLEWANNDRTNWIMLLGVDPKFDPLRSDPRFQALIKEIGLPDRQS
jgi:TolB-like protein/tetratricopeptide (TPR) repeat protein